MKRHFLLVFILAFTLVNMASAQLMDEGDINALVSGNTLTGRSVEGRFFSEYHLTDGRVFGNNGYYENTDACWTVKANQICYYYGEGKNRSSSCFVLEKSNDVIQMRLAPPNSKAGKLDALAKIQNGDPQNHSSKDKTSKQWICDGLVSNLTFPDTEIMSVWTKIKSVSNLKPNVTVAQLVAPEALTLKKVPLGAIPRLNTAPKPNDNLNFKSEKRLPPGQIAPPTDKMAEPFKVRAPQNFAVDLSNDNSKKPAQKLIKADTESNEQKSLPIQKSPSIKGQSRIQQNYVTAPNSFKAQPFKAQPLQRSTVPQQMLPSAHFKHSPLSRSMPQVPLIKSGNGVNMQGKNTSPAKSFPVIKRRICTAGKSTC